MNTPTNFIAAISSCAIFSVPIPISAPSPSAPCPAPGRHCSFSAATPVLLDAALELELPEGWLVLEHDDRPGFAAFENGATGEMIEWLPTRSASLYEGESPDLEPPKGWDPPPASPEPPGDPGEEKKEAHEEGEGEEEAERGLAVGEGLGGRGRGGARAAAVAGGVAAAGDGVGHFT